jgi:hypothetical protein
MNTWLLYSEASTGRKTKDFSGSNECHQEAGLIQEKWLR